MRRYYKAALKLLLSPEQVITLKNQCKFTGIDPDEDDPASYEAMKTAKVEHPKPFGSDGKGQSKSIFSSVSDLGQPELDKTKAGVTIQLNESSNKNLIPMLLMPIKSQAKDQANRSSANAYKKNPADQEMPDMFSGRTNKTARQDQDQDDQPPPRSIHDDQP